MADSNQGRAAPTRAPPEPESPGPGVETLRQVGVLVVDDQDYVRFTLDVTLREAGFLVWQAAGGREALDLYRRHTPAIDVVVLDVRMPGMDGPQTLAALREVDPDVRCCFLSGNVGAYTEPQLYAMGAKAVLYKPCRPESITRAVCHVAGPSGAPVRQVSAGCGQSQSS